MEEDRRTGLPMASSNVTFRLGGYTLKFKIDYPAGPATVLDFLPAMREISSLVVGVSEDAVRENGETISCRAGCGACCRQVVPVAPSEARALASHVLSLPEPERAALRARFADAVRRFDEGGLGEMLRRLDKVPEAEHQPFATAYFALRVPCPFLVEESCSIHPIRPMACREYLVTSPAEACAAPTPEGVKTVPVPSSPGNALRRLEGGWVPLVLAMEWSAASPEMPAEETGEALLRRYLELLSKG